MKLFIADFVYAFKEIWRTMFKLLRKFFWAFLGLTVVVTINILIPSWVLSMLGVSKTMSVILAVPLVAISISCTFALGYAIHSAIKAHDFSRVSMSTRKE